MKNVLILGANGLVGSSFNYGIKLGRNEIDLLDYKKMSSNFQPLAEEIIERAFNPDRIKRLSVIYNFEFKDWFDFY